VAETGGVVVLGGKVEAQFGCCFLLSTFLFLSRSQAPLFSSSSLSGEPIYRVITALPSHPLRLLRLVPLARDDRV